MEWSYEQELRLTFPEEIKDERPATFNTFYASELVEVYLGYRMSDDARPRFGAGCPFVTECDRTGPLPQPSLANRAATVGG